MGSSSSMSVQSSQQMSAAAAGQAGGDFGIHGYHSVRFVPQSATQITTTQTQIPAVVVRQQVAPAPVHVVPTQAPPPPPPATPKFTRPLAATAAVEGKQITLQAGVAGAQSISWIKDGRELTASPDFHISYDGSVAILIITCATLEDTGKYELIAKNQAGSQVSVLYISVEPSGDVTPQVGAPPKSSKEPRAPFFEKKIRHCKLIEGYNGWFEVIVNGEPRPKVEWRKDGEPINLNNSRYKTVSDPTSGFYSLTITCLVPQDRGEYTCSLMNASGTTQCTAWLLPEGDFAEVLNKERTKQTKDLERQKSRDVVNELSTVFTTSTRTATQRPQQQPQQQTQIVTGAPIRGPQPDEFIVSEELPEALAKLEAAQKARHQSGVNVDVEESKEKIIKPSFKKKPDDLEAREGRLVRFDCVVAGNPRPELSWFHNGYQIFDSSRCKILVNETGIHSLLFMQVSQHDTGTVSCIARNKGGEASFSVQLTVLERETIERPRFIERLPATLTIKAGSEILLSTTAEGVPTPMLSWQKDGVALSDGQGCRINTNGGHTQLIVEAASESSSGWYQCTAVNVGGTAAIRGKVLIDGGETSAAAAQRRQAERFEEVEERSTIAFSDERMRQLEQLEKRSQKSSIPQTQVVESEFSSERMKALEALETRHEKRVRHHEQQKIQTTKVSMSEERVKAIQALETKKKIIEDGSIVVPTFIDERAIEERMKAIETVEKRSASAANYSVAASGMAEDQAKTSQPKDEEPTENMFDANKKEPPVFKTNLKNAIVKEGQPGHLECRLIPIGDPSMKVEWFFNGKPIDIAHRFRMTYDFGYVALDMLYVYPEDSGEYRCVATNANGQAVTSCTVTCHQSSGIVTDTQLPEGHETVKKIADMEDWMEAQRKAQFEFEDTDEPGIPLFPVPLSPVTIPEMDSAKFICKVKAFPAAKVHWFINGKMVVNSARYRITYDGMMHQLEIPQAKSWDEGEIKIVAKNKLGVGVSKTTLTLVERDDYRRVLKRNVECDTHLYYSRHGKYATENEELEKAYMEKQKKSFTIKQHEDKTLHRVNRQLGEQVELRHVGVAPKLKLHLDDEHAINAMKHGLKKAGSVGADIVENFEALRLEKAQKEGRLDKNFRRDANLKHAEQVKHEIDKEQLPAFELQHAEIQTKEIKKSKLQIPELKSVPFEELKKKKKIERGKVKYRAEMEPWVVGHIKDVNVKEGNPAKFMVEYRGNPIPEVTWFKEELEIESSTQFQIMACDTHSY